MENKDLYKKAMDEIHAPEDLKRKTLNKINEKSRPKVIYLKYLSACAVFVLAVVFGTFKFVYAPGEVVTQDPYTPSQNPNTELATNLPTFKDIDELKNILKENVQNTYATNGIKSIMATADSIAQAEGEQNVSKESISDNREALDYSNTNVQVEGVDEADIIKTDGKYIYYLSEGILHIINAENLEEISYINYRDTESLNNAFSPREIFLANNKLVVVGDFYSYEITQTKSRIFDLEDVAYSNSSKFAEAIIYDVSNPREAKIVREVKIDGNYNNSRMIGSNLYFISTKTPFYYKGIPDMEILPSYTDSIEEIKCYIPANRIVYFEGTNNYNYVLIAGVDISKEEEVHVESFFGSWPDKIYASENNLYLPITKSYFWNETQSNEIYKFNLKDSYVEFVAKGTFEGYLNNQFSIDEYDGFLRIATTSGYDEDARNTLYIFDGSLKEVSKITDIAKGERIYSVRFMGKVGYIVTFEQIDPLFVVDLSDPYRPEIKGELEIPGYSSYLHPYDEAHIIGIGYNVKSNGYGGVTNANMKMAMFDVSDLSNPREMFSVNIGDEHVYTELSHNHKALFYSKTRNLIGFPITSWSERYNNSKMEFTLYDIDLENGFTVHGTISEKQDYKTDIQRAIYIGDNLYTVSYGKIIKYDLNTFEKLEELELYSNY